jgi:Beta-lactamase
MCYNLYLLVGEEAKARNLAQELHSRFPQHAPLNSASLPTILAAAELQRGNASKAIDLLKEAEPYELSEFSNLSPIYIRGQAYLRLHSPKEAEEGRIKLDGHVSDYLPYYRTDTGNSVIISELISHLGYSQFHIFPRLPGRAGQPNEVQRQEFRSEVLQRQFEVRARNEVRLQQLGYFLLGAVLEQISGSSYEQLLKDRIFTPLGMNDSGYTHSETIVPHRAAAYERFSQRFTKCSLL